MPVRVCVCWGQKRLKRLKRTLELELGGRDDPRGGVKEAD
jgi:hypothetical protein